MLAMKCGLVLFVMLTSILASELEEFQSGNNLFAASLYREISKDMKGNLLVSPFSAELVLALVESGARGETAEELKTVLNLSSDDRSTHAAIKQLLVSLQNPQDYLLYVVNKIYVNKFHQIKDEFKHTASALFSADVENIDFSRNVEAADKINKWVEKSTDNNVHGLISPDSLKADVRTILVNALYFHGDWSKKLRSLFTIKKDFYANIDNVTEVETMRDTLNCDYSENYNLNAKFLEIPFENNEFTITFVLPNEIEGLLSLEDQIEEVLSPQKFKKELVHLELPKFRTEGAYDFKEILKNLGVSAAFRSDKADFSGISAEPLYIDMVLQKTFINVNEDGVKAAAATSIRITPRFGQDLEKTSRSFIANHPFIYYIKMKDVIIFIGRLVWPSK